jgi:hypothetical protein
VGSSADSALFDHDNDIGGNDTKKHRLKEAIKIPSVRGKSVPISSFMELPWTSLRESFGFYRFVLSSWNVMLE